MDLDRRPSSALRFSGWSEPPLPFARAGSGREESPESGYLSLCGCSLEGDGDPGGAEAGPWSPPERGRAERRRKVEFFRKLGYSSQEVLAALQKHGPEADTNTVLGELVKHGAAPGEREPAQAAAEGPEAPPAPRARPAPGSSPAQPAPPEEQEGDHLRPIVIDGSNVAMRYVWAGSSPPRESSAPWPARLRDWPLPQWRGLVLWTGAVAVSGGGIDGQIGFKQRPHRPQAGYFAQGRREAPAAPGRELWP